MSSLYSGKWMPHGPGYEGKWIQVPPPGSVHGGVWMNLDFHGGLMQVQTIQDAPGLEEYFYEFVRERDRKLHPEFYPDTEVDTVNDE
jgi:hypothetical protein